MTPGDDTVSVVIPCYNGAKFLPETIRSALAQTRPVLEILVVDDGSTDDSAAVAEAFGPPVRVIRQPNQGESVARNRGIDEARGGWVAFLDADDLWEPEKVRSQLEAAEGEVQAYCTGCYDVSPSGRRANNPLPSAEFFTWQAIFRIKGPCEISSLMVRRSLPVRFPTWTRHGEDLIYFGELSRHTRLGVVPLPLTRYRRHGGGQSSKVTAWPEWHRTGVEWMSRVDLPAADREVATALFCRAIANACASACYHGDGDSYHYLVRYIRSRPDLAAAAAVVARLKYTRWVSALRIAVGASLRRHPRAHRLLRNLLRRPAPPRIEEPTDGV